MSVSFDIKKFDDKESLKLSKMLTIVPVENKVNYQQKYQAPSCKPVRMIYHENGIIYLPYRFACSYYNTFFNINEKRHLPIHEKKKEFSGKLLVRQKEPFRRAINYLREYRTVTIALYPGFGKTFMGVMLSWHINKITCVLVHRENIGDQWIKSFKKYMKITDDDIWFVGGKGKKPTNPKIMVCMDGRTDKIDKTLKDSVGTLIIDEAHCFCTPGKVKSLLCFTPAYIIAETATPTKDNGMHGMIQTICGIHYIKEVSTKPYNFYIIQTNLEFKLEGGGNVFGDLLNQQTESEEFNKIIINILKANQNKKTIIVTSRTNHCKELKRLIELEGMESSELYGTKKKYKPKNILIGTGSKMGTGFDEANFCDKDEFDGRASDLLIICQTYASFTPFEQVRGRGMRADEPTVVMFNNKNGITKSHFTKIRKWVRETKGNIIELNVDKIKDYKL